MRKLLVTLMSTITLLGTLMVTTTTAHNVQKKKPGERHPKIHQAINALESAKNDLQNAAHEFCGHRVEALEATNVAIRQLRLALESDRAAIPPANNATLQWASYVPPSNTAVGQKVGKRAERHPLIKRAITALQAAKYDMEHAADDFHGHKAAALEATNKALNQLHAALACSK